MSSNSSLLGTFQIQMNPKPRRGCPSWSSGAAGRWCTWTGPSQVGKEIVTFALLFSSCAKCSWAAVSNHPETVSNLAAWDCSRSLRNTSMMSFSLLHGHCTQSELSESCMAPNTSPFHRRIIMELSERDDPQTEQGEAEHTPSQQQTLLTHQTAQG